MKRMVKEKNKKSKKKTNWRKRHVVSCDNVLLRKNLLAKCAGDTKRDEAMDCAAQTYKVDIMADKS